MDRRVLRERMRRKQRQIRRRKIIKLVTYVVAMVLAVIFVIRGVIFPIVSRVGGKSTGKSQSVQADASLLPVYPLNTLSRLIPLCCAIIRGSLNNFKAAKVAFTKL